MKKVTDFVTNSSESDYYYEQEDEEHYEFLNVFFEYGKDKSVVKVEPVGEQSWEPDSFIKNPLLQYAGQYVNEQVSPEDFEDSQEVFTFLKNDLLYDFSKKYCPYLYYLLLKLEKDGIGISFSIFQELSTPLVLPMLESYLRRKLLLPNLVVHVTYKGPDEVGSYQELENTSDRAPAIQKEGTPFREQSIDNSFFLSSDAEYCFELCPPIVQKALSFLCAWDAANTDVVSIDKIEGEKIQFSFSGVKDEFKINVISKDDECLDINKVTALISVLKNPAYCAILKRENEKALAEKQQEDLRQAEIQKEKERKVAEEKAAKDEELEEKRLAQEAKEEAADQKRRAALEKQQRQRDKIVALISSKGMENVPLMHSSFGVGKIKSISDGLIIVEFAGVGEKRFVYPDSLTEYLFLADK